MECCISPILSKCTWSYPVPSMYLLWVVRVVRVVRVWWTGVLVAMQSWDWLRVSNYDDTATLWALRKWTRFIFRSVMEIAASHHTDPDNDPARYRYKEIPGILLAFIIHLSCTNKPPQLLWFPALRNLHTMWRRGEFQFSRGVGGRRRRRRRRHCWCPYYAGQCKATQLAPDPTLIGPANRGKTMLASPHTRVGQRITNKLGSKYKFQNFKFLPNFPEKVKHAGVTGAASLVSEVIIIVV